MQWRYDRAEPKSLVLMAIRRSSWEPPVKLASSMVQACRRFCRGAGACFSEKGVATAIGELPASCNSHWRVAQEEIAITNGDLLAINTSAHVLNLNSRFQLQIRNKSFIAHGFKLEISFFFHCMLRALVVCGQ